MTKLEGLRKKFEKKVKREAHRKMEKLFFFFGTKTGHRFRNSRASLLCLSDTSSMKLNTLELVA
jgi:hypothetical protein